MNRCMYVLRKLFVLFSLGFAATAATPIGAAEHPRPYQQQEMNLIYNLLFCDDLGLFRSKGPDPKDSPFRVLLDPNPDRQEVEKIAKNPHVESRGRLLAFNWLRQQNFQVPSKKLLGVIVEVPQKGGLDVLAAYEDGRIRYIHQTGKLAVIEETPHEISSKVKELLSASQVAVNRMGSSEKPRRSPPTAGKIRLTFLASDGLYFVEGPFARMQQDPVTRPIAQKASELLQLVVRATTK